MTRRNGTYDFHRAHNRSLIIYNIFIKAYELLLHPTPTDAFSCKTSQFTLPKNAHSHAFTPLQSHERVHAGTATTRARSHTRKRT